jgi:hypothetical protein
MRNSCRKLCGERHTILRPLDGPCALRALFSLPRRLAAAFRVLIAGEKKGSFVAFEMAYSVRRRTCRGIGIDWDPRSALHLSDAVGISGNDVQIPISPIKVPTILALRAILLVRACRSEI